MAGQTAPAVLLSLEHTENACLFGIQTTGKLKYLEIFKLGFGEQIWR